MDGIMLTDTINTANEILIKSNTDKISSVNYWMWIAIIELAIIVFIILFRKKTEHWKTQYKREAKEEDIDFGNIIKSSFHVKQLYDELKVKCHPDRFPNNNEKNQIALELFQEISKNKTNYKKLIELKELAIQKLNINF